MDPESSANLIHHSPSGATLIIRRSREKFGEPFTTHLKCLIRKGNKIAAMQEAHS
jgi:hypothetical protein